MNKETGRWESKKVVLTQEFKKLFESYGIDINKGELKQDISAQAKKEFFTRFIKLLTLTLQMRNSITGTQEDYLISPVKDENGRFYCSKDNAAGLPENADANGAYNIARKALWAIKNIKAADEDKLKKVKISISNKEWLEFAQR